MFNFSSFVKLVSFCGFGLFTSSHIFSSEHTERAANYFGSSVFQEESHQNEIPPIHWGGYDSIPLRLRIGAGILGLICGLMGASSLSEADLRRFFPSFSYRVAVGAVGLGGLLTSVIFPSFPVALGVVIFGNREQNAIGVGRLLFRDARCLVLSLWHALQRVMASHENTNNGFPENSHVNPHNRLSESNQVDLSSQSFENNQVDLSSQNSENNQVDLSSQSSANNQVDLSSQNSAEGQFQCLADILVQSPRRVTTLYGLRRNDSVDGIVLCLHCAYVFCPKCVRQMLACGRTFRCPGCRGPGEGILGFPSLEAFSTAVGGRCTLKEHLVNIGKMEGEDFWMRGNELQYECPICCEKRRISYA